MERDQKNVMLIIFPVGMLMINLCGLNEVMKKARNLDPCFLKLKTMRVDCFPIGMFF